MMKIINDINKIGRFGENTAVRYLRKNGYRIVARNVRQSHKELDIIAENKTDIIFVEVKTCLVCNESGNRRPADMVNYDKRKNTINAARSYLASHPKNDKCKRFDVIEVYAKKTNHIFRGFRAVNINHITNAFDTGGII